MCIFEVRYAGHSLTLLLQRDLDLKCGRVCCIGNTDVINQVFIFCEDQVKVIPFSGLGFIHYITFSDAFIICFMSPVVWGCKNNVPVIEPQQEARNKPGSREVLQSSPATPAYRFTAGLIYSYLASLVILYLDQTSATLIIYI